MESDANSSAFLNNETAELRKLGQKWGLSDDDIDGCLFEVCPVRWMDLWRESAEEIYKNTTRRHLLYLACAVSPILLLIVLNTPAVGMVLYVLPAEASSNAMYAVMSPYRRLASYFIPYLDFSGHYYADCIVENPLWNNPATTGCYICEDRKFVKQFKSPLKAMKSFLFSYVLVHRKMMPKNVTVEELVSLIEKNKNTVGNGIWSSVSWVKKLQDLADDNLAKKISEEKDFHVVWNSRNQLFDGQLMRKMFPRPKIFPPETESSVVKYVFIDGPHSSEYQLPETNAGENTWYVQGKGTKILLFTPLKECSEKCYSFHVTMNEGDILTYPEGGWHVKTLVNGGGISISYLSHLSLPS